MAMRNPFRPTFGTTPPLLVGRDSYLDEFAEALDNGPGSPGRATLYTGARGVGKTVMINAVEDLARQRGWLVVSETANAGLVSRLVESGLPEAADQLPGADADGRRLAGVTVPIVGGGARWDNPDQKASPGLRRQIGSIADQAAQGGTGLLITIDEVHAAPMAELRDVTTVIQHHFRENRELAFVAAGLPDAVGAILNDNVLTFLRRADRFDLGPVDLDEVAEALTGPIAETGRTIGEDAIDTAAQATAGYPFMIQLVGYHSFRQNLEDAEVSLADVEKGVGAAHNKLGSLVIEPELKPISDIDRAFLTAMAEDDGPSKINDIKSRLGVDDSYSSVYRRRLLERKLIVSPRRGYVDFALPAMRRYLRTN